MPEVQVFNHHYLNSVDGSHLVNHVSSGPVAMVGNRVVLSVSVENSDGGSTTFAVEGSHDGEMWEELADVDLTGAGHVTVTADDVTQAWVRVAATLTTAEYEVLFCAWLALSEQG